MSTVANAAPLLKLAGVGKDYAKIDTSAGRVRLVYDLLRGHGAAHVFRALDEVSFELAAGQSLGIVGENGAGKSTLLKVVAGVITPTRGSIAVQGRVGALLELGSGFHPEYSGLDNIDLAAALLDGRLALQWGDAVAVAVALALFWAGRWLFLRLSPHFEDFV